MVGVIGGAGGACETAKQCYGSVSNNNVDLLP